MNRDRELPDSAIPIGWSVSPQSGLVDSRGISYGVVQPGRDCVQGVPILRVNNIRNNRIEVNDVLRIAPEIDARHSRTRLKGGEVVLSLVGSLGHCAVVPPELENWNVARAVAVIPIHIDIDPRWVLYCLRSPSVQHLIRVWASTTVQATLNLRDVANLPILMPPSRQRERIADVLGTLDDKIELNRRMNRTLEEMAAAIFKSWFVDFDPVRAKAAGRQPEGMDAETAALFPDRLVDSEIGEIPEDWTLVPLSSAVDINPPRRLRKGDIAPYLDMANVPTSGPRAIGWLDRAYTSGSRFQKGDVLLARITPCLENGKTAFVDFLSNGETGWGSTEFIVLRSRSPLPPVWAYFLARDTGFREFAISSMSGTSGRQRVPANAIDRYKVAVPSSAIAKRFEAIVDPLFSAIKRADVESRSLARIRDQMLPRLLSGDLLATQGEASGRSTHCPYELVGG